MEVDLDEGVLVRLGRIRRSLRAIGITMGRIQYSHAAFCPITKWGWWKKSWTTPSTNINGKDKYSSLVVYSYLRVSIWDVHIYGRDGGTKNSTFL